MNETFLDVGELGWSLYLSAHLRWLKHIGKSKPSIMLLPGREVFYRGLVDKIFPVPEDFYTTFDLEKKDRFGFLGVSPAYLRIYINSKLPKGYQLSKRQAFTDDNWTTVFAGQRIFEPYEPKRHFGGIKNKIFVFPRFRETKYFNRRNLPRAFYVDLISRLCEKFQDYSIIQMGTIGGAYDIGRHEIKRPNYTCRFSGSTIEDLIWWMQFAIGAVGSQSFPLKLSLLQGVPSFIIGHEKFRHVRSENWMKTRVGFYEIDRNGYNDFYSEDCIDNIVEFLKEGR